MGIVVKNQLFGELMWRSPFSFERKSSRALKMNSQRVPLLVEWLSRVLQRSPCVWLMCLLSLSVIHGHTTIGIA